MINLGYSRSIAISTSAAGLAIALVVFPTKSQSGKPSAKHLSAKASESAAPFTASVCSDTMPSDLSVAFAISRHAMRGFDTDGDGDNDGYHATNQRERLDARFLHGAAIISHDLSGDAIEFRLAGAADCAPVMNPGNRVEYRHGEITEWYVNDEEGIEHGFVIESRPLGTEGNRVELRVDVGGGLMSACDPTSPGDLLFLDEEGVPVFDYRNLKVWDATGRTLEAHMLPTPTGFVLACDDSGAVYPVTIDPLIGSLERKLTASDGGGGDEFGVSVAISGDTAVIGAHLDATPTGSRRGSAYVFRNVSGTWQEEAKLVGTGLKAGDRFGFSVAISGDTVLVGAPLADLEPDPFDRPDGGVAYVFGRSGSTWSQKAILKASNGSTAMSFGWSVSLDGSDALIGTKPIGLSGRAYIFSEISEVWNQVSILYPNDGGTGGRFGEAVSIADGIAAVGAPGYDYPDPEEPFRTGVFDAGAVYVFEKGDSWTLKALIANPSPFDYDLFGMSVCSDSGRIAIGDPGSGKCHLYAKLSGTWKSTARFDGDDLAGFGRSVALSGLILVCGEAFADGSSGKPEVGRIVIFENTGGVWEKKPEIGSPSNEARSSFGISVAVSGDLVVAGAPGVTGVVGNGEDFLIDQGAAYVFRLVEGEPEIAVWQSGEPLADLSHDFGQVRRNGEYVSAFFQIRNTGTADLQGVTTTMENLLPLSPDFTLAEELLSASISSGASRIIEVRFLPVFTGESSATLRITSNDPDQPELVIGLFGVGLDRSAYEMAASAAGLVGEDALPGSKPFGDEVTNLAKFAFGLDLSKADTRTMPPGGTSGLPLGKWVTRSGNEFYRLVYLRRTDGSLTYTPQKSMSLQNGSFVMLTSPENAQAIAEAPDWERVTVEEPVNPSETRAQFFRVKVEER